MSDEVRVTPPPQLRGSVRVPGDKSTSHRALLLSALADGASSIRGLSNGVDVAATRDIVVALGAHCDVSDEVVEVTGPSGGLVSVRGPLDCGNSGTTMRLLCGVVSAVPGTHELEGDASLSKRPMDRVAEPLGLMGASVEGRGRTITPPLRVTTSGALCAIDYVVPVVSAQVKSAVLLAGLSALGTTVVEEATRTRDTTEVMLRAAGISVVSEPLDGGRRVTLRPGRPRRHDWVVPGDPSQAAFYAVLGALHRDAAIEVASIDAAPERVGFVSVLQRMGADVTLFERGDDHSLRAVSSTLHSTEIHAYEIPSVDEVPVLTVAACAASGVTAFRDVGELRLKESDRFAASMALARAVGARTWSDGDDFFVEGLASAERFFDFSIDGRLDHRVVMAAAVAGCAGHGCTIAGSATVSSSYPHFFRDLALLG